jgi:hypothetical protein
MFSLAAITVHILLGSVCMMPMAMAMDEETVEGHAMHHQMDSASEEDSDPVRADCGSTHCIMHAMPTPLLGVVTPDVCPHVPAIMRFFTSSVVNEVPVAVSAAPPWSSISVKTIVMRM